MPSKSIKFSALTATVKIKIISPSFLKVVSRRENLNFRKNNVLEHPHQTSANLIKGLWNERKKRSSLSNYHRLKDYSVSWNSVRL